MGVRCYYWNSRKVTLKGYAWLKISGKYNGLQLLYGNAGDIFNEDLIKWLYNEEPTNISDSGNRLLLVGSIMSQVRENDLLAGIGWKGNQSQINWEALKKCSIIGLRGPLTFEYLKGKGIDVSAVESLLDPGLLIGLIHKDVLKTEVIKNRVLFIPHYREHYEYSKKGIPKGIRVVAIDNQPRRIMKEILSAELVYTSSLHVIIFCHALGRPCVLVKPQTEEPEFKYKDYFASVGLEMPKPLNSIYEIELSNTPVSPIHIKKSLNDFNFPSKDHLIARGIISNQ